MKKSIYPFCVLAVVALLVPEPSVGQLNSPLQGYTPGQVLQGSPGGAIPLSGFEVFNPANSQLSLNIPLLTIHGRGSVNIPLLAPLTNPIWEAYEVCPTTSGSVCTSTAYMVQTADWNPFQPAIAAGGDMVMRPTFDYVTATSVNGSYSFHQTLTRGTFTTPDGTQTEFVDTATHGAQEAQGFNRGTSFIADNGSGTIFNASDPVTDLTCSGTTSSNTSCASSTTTPSGTMITRDGTRYTITNGTVTQIEDNNGNITLFSSGQITDNLGRNYSLASGNAGYSYYGISYLGAGGAPRTIKLRDDVLANHLISGTTQTYGQLFPTLQSNLALSNPDTVFNPNNIVYQIDLPDGISSYQLLYDAYGDVAQITLPTGGVIQYSYTLTYFEVQPPALPGGAVVPPMTYMMTRQLTQRSEYQNGTLTSQMKFPGNGEIDRYDGGGNLLAKETHSIVNSGTLPTYSTNYNSWQYNQSSNDTYYDSAANGAGILKTVTASYFQASNCSVNCNTAQTVTTTMGNSVKQTSFTYDQYSNVASETDSEWGSGAPGAVLRYTANTYNTNSSYTGANMNMLSLPMEIQVFDRQGGALYSDTRLGYDHNGTYIGNVADGTGPYPSANSIDGTYHDNTYFIGDVPRGNLTVQQSCQAVSGASCSSWLPKTVNTYDIAGNLVQSTDPNGHSTNLSYTDNYADGTNRSTFAFLTTTANALGQSASTQYDYYTGQPTLTTDLNGVQSRNYYNDGLDRLTDTASAVGTPAESWIHYNYLSATNMAITADQNSAQDFNLGAEKALDGFGRVTSSVVHEDWRGASANQIITNIGYDGAGRVASTTDPWRSGSSGPAWPAYTTTYSYDGLGRQTAAVSPDGSTARTSYSANQTTATDEAGHSKTVTMDGLGRVSNIVEDPGGSNIATSYTWTPAGHLTTVTQGTQTRQFAYDAADRLAFTVEPENGTVHYYYDNVGNTTSAVDARNITKTYTYDALNRVTNITYSDGTPSVTYTYDNSGSAVNAANTRGRLLSVANSSSTTNYTSYDAAGRVTASSQTTGTQTYNFSYSYNRTGALTKEVLPSGRFITTSYDLANRASTVAGTLGGVTTNYVTQSQYWPNGALSNWARGNNVTLTQSIDNRQRLNCATETNTTTTGQLWAGCLTWSANNTLSSSVYNNGGAGYPQFLSFTQNYTYDKLNRLTSVTDKTGSTQNYARSYNYDPWGNMWVTNQSGGPSSGTTPAANVYDSNTNRDGRWSYDNAGNLLSLNGNTASYDAENQLKSVTTTAGATETILYDAVGQRVQKTISGGGTTVYVYDLFGLAAEYASGSGNPPCTTCYLTTDHLGSGRAVIDQSANVVARHDYLPFGEEIAASTAGRDSSFGSTTDVTQKFTGQMRDQESGIDFFNARYFTAPLGRFNSPDPGNAGADLSNPQSWNGYAYVMGNPLNAVDPSGMDGIFPGVPSWATTVNGGVMDPVTTETLMPFQTLGGPFALSAQSYFQQLSSQAFIFSYRRTDGSTTSFPKWNSQAPSSQMLTFMRSCEGFSNTAYPDKLGNCTIGYGHLLHLGPCRGSENSLYMSEPAAADQFASDVGSSVDALNGALSVPLNQAQFDAIFSLTFNMGIGRLQQHDVWKSLSAGNMAAVPGNIQSLRGGGRGMDARRANEANTFANGVYAHACYLHP